MAYVLVTGGAGYIGSHTCKQLKASGYDVVVYDNLSTGHKDFVKWGPLIVGDIKDQTLLTETLLKYKPIGVIHFAASAYVGESVVNPQKYYNNNIQGTLSLLNAMKMANLNKLIVSSTCATYGEPSEMPISEQTNQQPINPYGFTKLVMEKMCLDYSDAYDIRSVWLRYFNAAGADLEGEVGELHEPETHLIPKILMVADQILPHIEIYGNDYDTSDGTCLRDYIHVQDLATGHIKALEYLIDGNPTNCFNLGTGNAYSVKEIITEAEVITGSPIKTIISPKRAGDPAALYANAAKAFEQLNWKPKHSDLKNILTTAWNWQQRIAKRN